MRIIIESVNDGEDALITVAGFGHAIVGDVGVSLRGWNSPCPTFSPGHPEGKPGRW
jgi:hypothetical protein